MILDRISDEQLVDMIVARLNNLDKSIEEAIEDGDRGEYDELVRHYDALNTALNMFTHGTVGE